MGLYSSLSVGISSLQAQSTKINLISENISNATTTGYIAGTQNFADLIASDTASDYSPGGVQPIDSLTANVGGDITTTSSPTDLAISGNGFPVSQSATSDSAMAYTREGSFTQDSNGNFVNAEGYFLQGYPLTNGALSSSLDAANVDSGTAIAALKTVNVADLTETPIATSAIALQANLDASQAAYSATPAYDPTSTAADMASGAIAPQFDTTATIIDSTGVSHTAEIGFLKTSTNSWAVEVYADPPTDVSASNPQIAAGTVTFNGDGTLASVSSSLTNLSVNWQNGTTSGIAFNWGTAGAQFGTAGATVIGRGDGLTQLATDSNASGLTQNGVAGSSLSSVSVDSGGDVVGTYADGSTRSVYKIPLVNFYDPDQLENVTGNIYAQTENSGAANFSPTGEGGVGTIQSQALEESNVDLSGQLSDLIVAQNAYQSSAKLISTSDTMLSDLVTMGAT